MGVKIDEHTIKYKIIARFEVDGVVERPDIIGAVFGQTDGLLPPDLNLRDLQKTGKLGRIEVKLTSQGGKTTGVIELPTNLDKVRTAIIAATVETVDRVGPCHAKVTLEKIEDVRDAKRREIIERAAEIVKGWEEKEEEFPEVTTLLEEKFKEKTTKINIQDKHAKELTKEIIKFGKDKLYAGPDLPNSKEIIIVEGRADIINLLRAGIRNTIEVGGTNVPQTVIDLIRQRTAIAFLDGDRGGDFILKELLQVAPPDYVARAPLGKEVEELTPEEIKASLKNKKPIHEATFITEEKPAKKKVDKRKHHETRKEKPKRRTSPPKASYRTRPSSRRTSTKAQQRSLARTSRKREQREPHVFSRTHHEYSRYPPLEPALKAVINAFEKKLRGSFQSYLLDKDYVPIEQVPTEKLYKRLKEINNGVHAVLYDGVLTKRISEVAAEKNISVVAATVKGDIKGAPPQVRLITFDQAKQ